MIVSKEEFLKIIKELQEIYEFNDALADLAIKYHCGDFWDYPDARGLCCSLLNKVLGLKDSIYGSDLNYFVEELNFGNNWTPDSVTDKDGNSIDWSTAEKFYDWLVEHPEV